MKLFKSKKGVGTSVIVDVFALLAYFSFFIIVVILISNTGIKSKAEITPAQVKADYSIVGLSVMKTPMNVSIIAGEMTFAEYLAYKVDTLDLPPDMIRPEMGTAFIMEVKDELKEMEPAFSAIEDDICLKVEYEGLPDRGGLKMMSYAVTSNIDSRFKDSKGCEDYWLANDLETDAVSFEYPTRDKYKVKVSLYYKIHIPVYTVLLMVFGSPV